MKIKKYNIPSGVILKRKSKPKEKKAIVIKAVKKRAKKTPISPELLKSGNPDFICQAQDFIFMRRSEWLKERKKTLLARLRMAITIMLVFGLIAGQTIAVFGGEAHVVNVTATIANKPCVLAQTRTIGYWKNHSEVYIPLLPQFLGDHPADDPIQTAGDVNDVFNADNSIMRNKLKKQLLAMKFNIAGFSIGGFLVESIGTLDQIAADADNLLRANPAPADSILEAMKNLLDYLNNLEQISSCGILPPSPSPDPAPSPSPELSASPAPTPSPSPDPSIAPSPTPAPCEEKHKKDCDSDSNDLTSEPGGHSRGATGTADNFTNQSADNNAGGSSLSSIPSPSPSPDFSATPSPSPTITPASEPSSILSPSPDPSPMPSPTSDPNASPAPTPILDALSSPSPSPDPGAVPSPTPESSPLPTLEPPPSPDISPDPTLVPAIEPASTPAVTDSAG